MSAALLQPETTPFEPGPTSSGPELVELSLLVPRWQVNALERLADEVGVTVGQMLRRLLGDYVQLQAAPAPTRLR